MKHLKLFESFGDLESKLEKIKSILAISVNLNNHFEEYKSGVVISVDRDLDTLYYEKIIDNTLKESDVSSYPEYKINVTYKYYTELFYNSFGIHWVVFKDEWLYMEDHYGDFFYENDKGLFLCFNVGSGYIFTTIPYNIRTGYLVDPDEFISDITMVARNLNMEIIIEDENLSAHVPKKITLRK